jgi:hypothetical protein
MMSAAARQCHGAQGGTVPRLAAYKRDNPSRLGSAKLKEHLPMIKNRSRTVRAAVVAGVMALLLGPAAAAQAAVVPVNFNLTGGLLTIGGLPVEIPATGATLAGNWDNESGAFDGALTIPAFSVDLPGATSGLPLDVTLDVTISAGPVVGTVPPDGAVGSVTTSLTVGVGVALLGLECTLGPVNLSLATSLAEDGADIILTATGAGFTVPAAVCSDPSLGGLVNDALALPTSETSIELVAVLGDSPAPTPEPTPVTPEEAEVIVAAATPKFTG